MAEFDRKQFALTLLTSMSDVDVSEVVEMGLPGTEGWRAVADDVKGAVREAYEHRKTIDARELADELADGLVPADEGDALREFSIIGAAWEVLVGDPDDGVPCPDEPTRFMDVLKGVLCRAYEDGIYALVTHVETATDEAEGDHDVAELEAEEDAGR